MQTDCSNIPPEWKSWIRENLQRGCRVQTIVDAMVEKRFDPLQALVGVLSEATHSPGGSEAIAEWCDQLKRMYEPAPEWRPWINEKLSHGWTSQEIFYYMLKNGVNPVAALPWVFSEAAKRQPRPAVAIPIKRPRKSVRRRQR